MQSEYKEKQEDAKGKLQSDIQLKQIKAWVITGFSEFLKGGGIT